MIVEVIRLALQAVDAFIGIDMPVRVNCLNGAAYRADPALSAALMPPLEPFEHSQPRWNTKSRPKRAKVAAIEAFDEKTG